MWNLTHRPHTTVSKRDPLAVGTPIGTGVSTRRVISVIAELPEETQRTLGKAEACHAGD
jgi:hypothetical protein